MKEDLAIWMYQNINPEEIKRKKAEGNSLQYFASLADKILEQLHVGIAESPQPTPREEPTPSPKKRETVKAKTVPPSIEEVKDYVGICSL